MTDDYIDKKIEKFERDYKAINHQNAAYFTNDMKDQFKKDCDEHKELFKQPTS